MFAIHPEDGKLSSLGFQTTMGETPRNFSIDPSGKWLLVANQESNNVVIFKRSVENGMLEYSGTSLEIPNPVCLKFLKKP